MRLPPLESHRLLKRKIKAWTRNSTDLILQSMGKQSPATATFFWHSIWLQKNNDPLNSNVLRGYLDRNSETIFKLFPKAVIILWLYYPNETNRPTDITELSTYAFTMYRSRLWIKLVTDDVFDDEDDEDKDIKTFVMTGTPECIGARVDMLKYVILSQMPGVYSDLTDISFDKGQALFMQKLIEKRPRVALGLMTAQKFALFYDIPKGSPVLSSLFPDGFLIVCFDSMFPRNCIERAKRQCFKLFNIERLSEFNKPESGQKLMQHFSGRNATWEYPWCEVVPTYITGPNTILYALCQMYPELFTLNASSKISILDIVCTNDNLPSDSFLIDPAFFTNKEARTWMQK